MFAVFEQANPEQRKEVKEQTPCLNYFLEAGTITQAKL